MGAVGPFDATDAALVVASMTDPQQFAPIFDRHATAVYRYLVSRAGPQAADDLLSEVFVTAFRCRGSFDTTYGDARPWLLGIATNTLRHHYRAERRRSSMLGRVRPLGRDQVDHMEEDLTSDMVARDQVGAMRTAMGRLDQRYVEVLVLFAAFDLSYEEIARVLRLRIGTVRSRLSRGRAQLRELLAASGQYGAENDLAGASSTAPEEERQP
ncbi:MAG: RNA polymerase sigma factor [Acidimicrobiales bacterium]